MDGRLDGRQMKRRTSKMMKIEKADA